MTTLDFRRPASTDKYFLTIAQGGYYPGTYGMPNCITYVEGFWWRLQNDPTFKNRPSGNPPAVWDKYKTFGNGGRGQYPRVGAMMIWYTGKNSKGEKLGHIAICKSYNSKGSVTWVESNFSAREKGKEALYWREVKNRNPSKYVGTFLGYIYIYNPNPHTYPTIVLNRKKFEYGKIKTGKSEVKWAQYQLQKAGLYTGRIDGFFGPATEAAVKAFQKKNGLEVDGSIGPKTRQKLEVVGYNVIY